MSNENQKREFLNGDDIVNFKDGLPITIQEIRRYDGKDSRAREAFHGWFADIECTVDGKKHEFVISLRDGSVLLDQMVKTLLKGQTVTVVGVKGKQPNEQGNIPVYMNVKSPSFQKVSESSNSRTNAAKSKF